MQNLTWALMIATKDRVEPLETCVALALSQTRPPCEVVIADCSLNWQDHSRRIAELAQNHPKVRFCYLQGDAPSLTVQRNQVIAAGTADIFFMIDDDSFMHPTCAAEIMSVYEADRHGAIAGVQAAESPHNPARMLTGARKPAGADLSGLRARSSTMRWFLSRIMMMSKVDVFVPYDGSFPKHALPESLQTMDIGQVELFGGFRMTYRRDAIRREGFDPCLRYYCPGEDLDTSYRVSRHGALVTAKRAFLYHHTSASGRLNRVQVAHLWSFNQAVLLRRHADDQVWARRAWQRKMAHRMITDLLKDTLMRRFNYPQSRGTWRAWQDGRKVFGMSAEVLDDWYPQMQEQIVKG